MARFSKEIPGGIKAEKKITRGVKENRKRTQNIDASFRRERYGTQSGRRSGGSSEKEVKEYFRASISKDRGKPIDEIALQIGRFAS
jgi:hypothetical protein